jgi:hypothetical protein
VLGTDVYLFGSAVAVLVVVNAVLNIAVDTAVDLIVLHGSFLLSFVSMPNCGAETPPLCKKGSIL